MTPEPSNEYLVEAERFAALIESRIGQMFDEEAHLSGDEARRIAFTLRALPHAGDDGWQDISTAPKKGLIDIWIKRSDGGVRWTDCYYDSICGEWRTTGPSGHLVSVKERFVTHWRPLPTPPAGVSDNG